MPMLPMLFQVNAYGGMNVRDVLVLLCKAAQLAVKQHAKTSLNGSSTMQPSGQGYDR